MSALGILSVCPPPPTRTDHLRRARISGESRERQRIVRYLLSLENDEGYEWESPAAVANRLLCGVHHQGGK